jgi:hypothetical protein
VKPPVDLEKLSFGAPAAERDTALASYFVESDAFKLLQKRKKTIVLGNRGAGKAILRTADREAGSRLLSRLGHEARRAPQ